MIGLQRIADAALDMRLDDLLIEAFQQGLRGEQLIGNLDAVAVLLDHSNEPVQLAAGNFELLQNAVMIGTHGIFLLYGVPGASDTIPPCSMMRPLWQTFWQK